MGCHLPLQGIAPTQGTNLHLLHCRRVLYHSAYLGSPSCTKFFQNIVSIETKWERNDFKASTLRLWEQLEAQGRADVVAESAGDWKQDSHIPWRCQSFLVGLSTDWMRPTHIMEDNLLYSKSTDLTASTPKKHLHSNNLTGV